MKTPDQFSTKQLLEFFDSGIITVEQLNHLVRTLRTDREEYARQAEEHQRKYLREHIDTNRWKNRAELAEARIKLADSQEPIYMLRLEDDEWKECTKEWFYADISSGLEKRIVYARPMPEQQSTLEYSGGIPFVPWSKEKELFNSMQQSPAVAVLDEETNFCALKSITDSQVNAVARAFWRRIYAYRNDYGIELPKPLPVEFMAHMATALTWVDKDPAPTIAKQEAPGIDFEDLQRKKNDPLHMAVSNWYARLTGCDAVADEGEHVGYCCPMKMMDELEEILAAPVQKQEPLKKMLTDIKDQQQNAWIAVCRALSEVNPGWVTHGKKGVDCAVDAIRLLSQTAQAAAIPEWLMEMSEQMRTQDNRGTSHPFFQVRRKRYIVTEQGYNEFGYELCNDDGVIYRSYAAEEDDLEKLLIEDYPEFCEQWRINQGEETVDDAISSFDPTEDDLPEGVRLVYVQETEEIVSTHLTEIGARQFIRRKQHDYPKLYTYAESAYWSPQLRQLQDWIISLSATPKPDRKFVDLRQVVEDGSK